LSHSKPAYYRLPAAALENIRLTRSALIVLAVLIDQSDYGAPELTIDELAELAGIAPRSVRRSLHELAAAELIEVTHTGRASRYNVREILPPKQRRPQQQQRCQKRSSSSRLENASIDPAMLDALQGGILS
jgi:predicted ArsR family transcriptional regulator